MFDEDWKEEVEDSVSSYSSLSEEAEDPLLNKEIKKVKFHNCIITFKMKALKCKPSAEFGGNVGIFGLKTPLHAYV